MNKSRTRILKTLALILTLGCVQCSLAQESNDSLDISKLIRPLTDDGIFSDPNYFHWGASIIKGDDDSYHLFYSRWKKEDTFNGWLTDCEIAHAVSSCASGPWTYKETVLKGRGNKYWDAITAHNPKIKCFDGKYYLYYISTNLREASHQKQQETNIERTKENSWATLRANQRTGVAVSNSINGPWTRSAEPLIEPSGPIANITVNPAIAKGKDGLYYLIIKGDKPNEKKFIRNQAIASSISPTGPFTMQPDPVIGNLDTEDVSMWYDEEMERFYAIFHAHTFIGLMSSEDGLHWAKAQHYMITDKKLLLDDGTILKPNRMERPFVYIENGQAKVLCLAIKKGDDAFTIFIPLLNKE